MNRKIILIILSVLFVIFSFLPSLYEIKVKNVLPANRAFVLEHNYMFDFNFYLSRIREGQEGRFLVVEKYFNEPHNGSLLQIIYLFMGKMGGILGLMPTFIYHMARLILGFIMLFLISQYIQKLFDFNWSIIAFLLVVTSGSYPALIFVNEIPRFATYMGWWSAIDSLQRITFIPHIIAGQIGLLLFIWRFGERNTVGTLFHLICWGVGGFVIGIIFPPTLVILYVIFFLLSFLEIFWGGQSFKDFKLFKKWFLTKGLARLIFSLFSVSSLLYLQLIFRISPWSALPLFDIQHRILLPYKEYFLALGPMLPLGLLGLFLVLYKKDRKFYPLVSWVGSIFLLFKIFEKIPEQSPLRFTEAAIHIPLGILAAYFFYNLWLKVGRFSRPLKFIGSNFIKITLILFIFMGLGVMGSMVLWLTDQVRWKSEATWSVPIGAQLAYPLKEFMEGIYFLRDKTDKNSVVFSYVTAGNYIPAYAGNFVYIGHANTPDEDGKEKIAARFFKAEMSVDEARNFLHSNHISYIYFGPQEKELGGLTDLKSSYPFVYPIYTGNSVTIYSY